MLFMHRPIYKLLPCRYPANRSPRLTYLFAAQRLRSTIHWSERGRATSVGDFDALGRPRRSVRSFGHMKASRTLVIVSALPGLLMLGVFYSLAIHMRWQLGAWPQSIGDRGFPTALSAHGRLAWDFCALLLLISMVVVPLGILVCLLVARWRPFVRYFALYSLVNLVCWGLMLLAPAPFLTWWWD